MTAFLMAAALRSQRIQYNFTKIRLHLRTALQRLLCISGLRETQGAEMADFWIVGGLMAGAFVSPLYFLVMRWLTGSQRATFFVLIGALLLVWRKRTVEWIAL